MTIEQREYKLNKRIAIFEQKLNVHCALLSMSCPTITGIEKVIAGFVQIESIKMQMHIIASQPIPKFPKDGETYGDMAFVSETGNERIVSGTGIYREAINYKPL